MRAVKPQHLELRDVSFDRWLTPKELAGHFGRMEDSAYRWKEKYIPGQIPARYLRYSGPARMLFHPDIISMLEKIFEAAHD